MKVNENIVICGDNVILVPYRAEHVPKYHEWMKSPELLEATASEPLSLDEEYEMQRKWHDDDDKLTFILLDRPDSLPSGSGSTSSRVLTPDQIRQCRMVGDINMFLPEGTDGDAECEIMIASPSDRRKGFAREALNLFLSYAVTTLSIKPTQLIARIGTKNAASIALFHKLGFGTVKVVEVFQEMELRWGHIAEGGTHKNPEWAARSLEGLIGVYDE